MRSYTLFIPFERLLADLALFPYTYPKKRQKRQKRQIRHCASYLTKSQSDPAADDGLFDVNDFQTILTTRTGESGKAGQAGVSEPDGEAAMTNLTNLTFFHGHIETSDAGTASRPGGEGATEPQLECIKELAMAIEREELDDLVSQLPPDCGSGIGSCIRTIACRHYPYIDARRWAWWELQRELNRRNPRGDS
jgi:hypothetical protein